MLRSCPTLDDSIQTRVATVGHEFRNVTRPIWDLACGVQEVAELARRAETHAEEWSDLQEADDVLNPDDKSQRHKINEVAEDEIENEDSSGEEFGNRYNTMDLHCVILNAAIPPFTRSSHIHDYDPQHRRELRNLLLAAATDPSDPWTGRNR